MFTLSFMTTKNAQIYVNFYWGVDISGREVGRVLINVDNKPQSANGDNLSRLSVNIAQPGHICCSVASQRLCRTLNNLNNFDEGIINF